MRESTFYQEIKAEGSKETKRGDMLFALENRFGAQVATEVAKAVNSVDDLEQLDRLYRLAITCQGFDEFRAALPPTTGQERPTTRRRPARRPRR